MQSRINLVILVCLVMAVSIGLAQQTTVSEGEQQASALSFPYVAEIVSDDIYIRSGPGTNYYQCGKLNRDDRVKVVGSKFSWSQISPPSDSFSWISKQYVKIDPEDKTIGTVTGDNVRVWAGSETIKPVHSSSMQLKLNTDDKVTLLGEELDDYHKITPPSGAYLWVSTKYTKPLGAVGEVPLLVRRRAKAKADTAAVVPTGTSLEAEKLKVYHSLKERLDAERAKPIMKQNYWEIKKGFAEIAGNRNAGKAVRYAAFALQQTGRCELALESAKEIRLQEAMLRDIEADIEKARKVRLARVKDLGRFAVIGKFKSSNIYDSEGQLKYYRIIDDSGKTACYALPGAAVSQVDLSRFIDRRVGLVGTIRPHPQTSGALVEFTEIVELK